MKKMIKNSIEKIEIDNSQKEEIYQNIVNKKNLGFNNKFKYAFVCALIVFCIAIVDTPSNINEVRMISADNLVINDEAYEVVYIDYELGERLEDVTYRGMIYEVYINDLLENSIVLYNQYYEVYLKIEEKK